MECTGTTLKKKQPSYTLYKLTNLGFTVINYWCYVFKTGKKINHKRTKWLGMEPFRVNITTLTTEQNLNIISVILSRVIPQYITSPTYKTQITDIIYWPCEPRLCDRIPWFQPQHVFSFVWLSYQTTWFRTNSHTV